MSHLKGTNILMREHRPLKLCQNVRTQLHDKSRTTEITSRHISTKSNTLIYVPANHSATCQYSRYSDRQLGYGSVLTALDMNSAGGVGVPQKVLCHTRVIPRILQLGSADLDPGVLPVAEGNTNSIGGGTKMTWKHNPWLGTGI